MECSVQFQAIPSRHFSSLKNRNCSTTSSILRFSSNNLFNRGISGHHIKQNCRIIVRAEKLRRQHQNWKNPKKLGESNGESEEKVSIERRNLMISSFCIAIGSIWNYSTEGVAFAAEFADMPALRGKDYGKTKMKYPDYVETDSGLQYKDLRRGDGPTPNAGDTVVVDWDGYTIGYYGRIFEARNKTKGGSFVGDDKDFFKFRVGSREVIPAFEEAISGMAPGGVRRIIVPPELGYPENDYNKSSPRPTTFSGQRALDFVLKNQGLIDKTLLFDIELLKIIPK